MTVPVAVNSASVPSAAEAPELDGRRRHLRVGHLRGDGALPDQVVQRELVGVELTRHLAGGAEHVTGGADGLVRLLRVLHLALVAPRGVRHVLGAVQLPGLAAGRADGLLRQVHRVGAHVGDVAVLVQRLRHAHRALAAPAQAVGRLLLERRRDEGGLRLPLTGLLDHGAHRERGCRQSVGEAPRPRLVEQDHGRLLERALLVEVAARDHAHPVDRRELRVERAA